MRCPVTRYLAGQMDIGHHRKGAQLAPMDADYIDVTHVWHTFCEAILNPPLISIVQPVLELLWIEPEQRAVQVNHCALCVS